MPKPEEAIRQYLAAIDALYRTGKATEHSYRPALRDLLSALLPEVAVINEPKRIECGAPDYILQKGGMPVAFVEAKDIGDPDLAGRRKNREQFDRYKAGLDAIAFTDYLDFRLWRDGRETMAVRLGEERDGKLVLNADKADSFLTLVAELGNAAPQKIRTATQLARQMAGKAQVLREVAEKVLAQQEKARDSQGYSLYTILSDFKRLVTPEIDVARFADMYAQTVTYGMFAARLHDNTPENFTRIAAAECIPRSNPFLKGLFLNISSYLESELQWIVDDIARLFAAADMPQIMSAYGEGKRRKDPMIHFYEDFLDYYDPALKRDMGVWYTWLPIVQFIIRAVDCLLVSDFGMPDGLADGGLVKSRRKVDRNIDRGKSKKETVKKDVEVEVPRVQVLDPATGTGTFLAECLAFIHGKFAGNEGRWPSYVAENLIPRLHGLELLVASYTIAHIKMDLALRATGCDYSGGRFNIFLTDSLDAPANDDKDILFSTTACGAEKMEANKVKCELPIMVVIGNPPYKGESGNKSQFILDLLKAYKKEPGEEALLKEGNPKWLNDDYVKFIRLAEHYIERNGSGIVAYITNHAFIDNLTFRGMRWHLLQTFDDIYHLNLHGNVKKKETAPDGSKDENVFGIKQGVGISVFVKRPGAKTAPCRVHYADCWGTRDAKFDFLDKHAIATVPWTEIAPLPPQYFFVPKDFGLQAEYGRGFGLAELFPENTTGVVSAADELNFSFTREEQEAKIAEFLSLPESKWRSKYHRPKDSRDWTYTAAKADAAGGKGVYCPAAYRPFDERYTYYTGVSRGIYTNPRDSVMRNFIGWENLGLVLNRGFSKVETNGIALGFITRAISEHRFWSCSGMPSSDYIFPLYLYARDGSRTSNLNSEILAKLEKAIGRTPSPEEVFDYIYAVLHAPQYRTRYAEFLKVDFPRVPYPADDAAFRERAAIGKELRETHLMHDAPPPLSEATAAFPVAGDNRVEKAEYAGNAVWINESQRFANVPAAAWEMRIGGYQPAEKWLKDRKGRCLSDADLAHYQRIILALRKTGELMARLAELTP